MQQLFDREKSEEGNQAPRSCCQALTDSQDQASGSTSRGRIIAIWTYRDLLTSTICSWGPRPSLSKTNFRVLGSYNWLTAQKADRYHEPQNIKLKPAIVVPGMPAQWDPPELPKQLTPDNDLTFIVNENAYRLPHCPIEPLLQALLITQPTMDLDNIDIICDRKVLQNLFTSVIKIGKNDRSSNFDIGIEMIKNTALFTHLSDAVISPFRGYGHTFEREFTKPSEVVSRMGEHYRIVGYTFAGFNMIVRYGADTDNASSSGLKLREKDTKHNEALPKGPIIGASSSSSVQTQRLLIQKAGKLIPQEQTIEIKIYMAHPMPHCWFSNTRNIYIGRHKDGVVTAVTKCHIEDQQVAAWEHAFKNPLAKFAELLRNIVRLGKGHDQARVRIRCVNDSLTVEEWRAEETTQYSVMPLPRDLREKWVK